MNLLNYINIINGIWSYFPEKNDSFVNVLKELGIYFSWVIREKNLVDVILLTKKSLTIYNHISN